MSFRSIVILSIISFSGEILAAQDIDGDSVYYTPIPKPGSLNKNNKSASSFQGTTLSRKHAYFLSLQTGSLVGCSNCGSGKDVSFTSSLVNGITIGEKIRAGIGFGFDSYAGWQTLPAFASWSWDVFGNKNKNALFIQFNYGFSKAWHQKSDQDFGFKSAEGGRMIAPQLGYRIKYHDLRLSLAVGVKLQRVFSYYEYPNWTWFNGEYIQTTSTASLKREMSRLVFAMSFGWR